MKYYASTIDRHNSGARAGQIVTDSAWSADVVSEAVSMDEALKEETKWTADAMDGDCKVEEITGIDTENGLIWWVDSMGDEYVTEVSIDFAQWYAVLADGEDDDWGTGSYSEEEAKRMAEEIGPEAYIAVIEEGNDPVCVEEIRQDSAEW